MRAFKHLRGVAMVTCVAASLSLGTSGAFAAGPPQTDPLAQQATLTASDEIGQSLLGSAVALSRDGNTALIGGPNDNEGVGAAWVFIRKGSTWTEQAKLTGDEEAGAGQFGSSVALSSDGKTALIGGPADNGGLGAAWVFTRRGSTWTQRGSKLTGSGENALCAPENEAWPSECHPGQVRFGESVALSSSGKTALVGGPGDDENDGAAWVFTRRGAAWTQEGEKLTGAGEQNLQNYQGCGELLLRQIGGQFGASVALSADGKTALIGGPRDAPFGGFHCEKYFPGAAWVFTRSGSKWNQQGGKLTDQAESPVDGSHVNGLEFGESVAMSADGNTALAGEPSYFSELGPVGGVLAFTRSGSVWTRQGELRETGPGEGEPRGEELGGSFGLSADGNTALVRGFQNVASATYRVAAWVFTRSGSMWTKQVPPLTCDGEGCVVVYYSSIPPALAGTALSGDASTALVGTAVYVNAPHK